MCVCVCIGYILFSQNVTCLQFVNILETVIETKLKMQPVLSGQCPKNKFVLIGAFS